MEVPTETSHEQIMNCALMLTMRGKAWGGLSNEGPTETALRLEQILHCPHQMTCCHMKVPTKTALE